MTVPTVLAELERLRANIHIRGRLQRGIAGSCDGVVDFDGDDVVAFADCTPNRAALIAAAISALPDLIAVARAADNFMNARADDYDSLARLRAALARLATRNGGGK